MPLGPLEAAPHLAVACSGGADSLALTLLGHAWAGARGGRITALVVDHAMRAGSAAEARLVKSWLDARDIESRILTHEGPPPGADRQAAGLDALVPESPGNALLRDACAGKLHADPL